MLCQSTLSVIREGVEKPDFAEKKGIIGHHGKRLFATKPSPLTP
jgi:hypothetical protein